MLEATVDCDTEPSFLNMFHHDDIFEIEDEQQIELLSQSPFCNVIHNVKMHSYVDCPLGSTIYLIPFRHLQSLDFVVNWNAPENENFDITPVFQALGPKLQNFQLKMHKSVNDVNQLKPPKVSLCHFQNALSLLTSLTSLTFMSRNPFIFTNISFLSHMKKLQSFNCNCIGNYAEIARKYANLKDTIDQLSLLPDLTYLYLDEWQQNISIYLKEISKQLENSQINHLGLFDKIHGSPRFYNSYKIYI
jgi:hypothetical protein